MNEHVAVRQPALPDAYEADFSAWSLRQADLLRNRQLDSIDIDNIAEEIESLARKEHHSVEKRMRTLIEHLLKLQFFTLSDGPRRGWRVTVAKSRDNLATTFRDSPSLSAQRDLLYLAAWDAGARTAALAIDDDTAAIARIHRARDAPIFTVEQALDPDFFPPD